jgi:3-hydroxyacyl-[acyl-carrier-protein] dehydratase
MEFFGLPHRPPFVFVKEVRKCEPGIAAECESWFEADDPMFVGHFPDNPLVPGVILTEALAQAAGIAAASGLSDEDSPPRFLLSAIRQMKFFQAVGPNEKVTLRATKVAQVEDLLQFTVEATVDQTIVASGQIVLNQIGKALGAGER